MGEMRKTRFDVEGMDCASCASKIDTAVRRMPGVSDVAVSVTTQGMIVHHDETADLSAVARKVSGLGYKTAPARRAEPKSTVQAATCCGGHAPHADAEHDHDSADRAGRHQGDHQHGSPGDHAREAPSTMTADAPPAGLHGHDHGPMSGPWWASAKGRLTLLCGAALVLAYAVGHVLPTLASPAFLIALLVGLVPIGRRAVMAALAGTPFSIEMLMTIAAIGAVVIDAGEEAAAVVFLFLVGELLEGVAASRARRSIQALTDLVPKTAFLDDNGTTREVAAETLAPGNVIRIRPGDRIPADGEILSGESAIDEAPVTGESVPVRKAGGDPVFAGTVNGEGVLRVTVTAAAADNTIARVVRLVEEAQEAKAPTERFIDRFSRYYTPGVVLVAALVAILPPLLADGSWSEWVYKGLAILLIGCPCALVISTPAAITASLSAGARRGLLVKGGAVLEKLGTIDTVAFDKTGTLTQGRPEVTDILSFTVEASDVLRLSAALDAGSSHPLALAILARAERDGIPYPAAENVSAKGGKGVAGNVGQQDLFLGSPRAAGDIAPLTEEQARAVQRLNDDGRTVSVLVVDGQIAGAIAMRDEPRKDARQALAALKAGGIRTLMLTGDNRRVAEAVGRDLEIDVRAELLPEDKQTIVRELKAQGAIVAKVGDGINDAPALAAADVGIAIGGGTDVALETADAAILHGRIADVAALIALSKRCMANIRQNIAVALGLKAIFLVTTVVGITGLWPAILADTGATVLVTINALRLLHVRA
ncbi:heavy metal translocating P-type ATPase [Rhizobium sp. Leaf341]|uniref:heavy metal translocating P-type ATPase n=1 Tax=Rhizobium sp. Leaf341 TaxID=1736344 RepID=UPI000713E074|nr:heavy metal translocating P-type ATPase [Rhizobium sp. Leaf341]KQR77972.1 ATPase [Rhizobium sp. Leaf341]